PVDHVVDAAETFAEKIFEIRTCIVELCKDEAPIIPYVANGADPLARMARLKSGVFVSLPQRDKEQRAVRSEGPRVIGAAKEFSRIAARVSRYARSLVRTTVVQHLHAIVGMSHHQNRLCPDRGAKIISRFCHLAVMADIDPGVCEQVLHFEREDFIVDVDVAMNLRLPNQISDGLDISAVSGHRHLLSISKGSSTS